MNIKDAPLELVQKLIAAECDGVRDMLLEKNRAYGNSALDPVRVFSKASTREQLLVRLDDKLSRLARGAAAGEDVIKDIIGYLHLLRVQDALEALPAGATSAQAEQLLAPRKA